MEKTVEKVVSIKFSKLTPCTTWPKEEEEEEDMGWAKKQAGGRKDIYMTMTFRNDENEHCNFFMFGCVFNTKKEEKKCNMKLLLSLQLGQL